MTITKFDLYNPEWLEIVFDSKNKEYGAYDLRKHYAQNLVKAMAIAFFSVAFLYTAYSILKPKPEIIDTIPYNPTIIPPPAFKKDVIIPPSPPVSHPQVQSATVKYQTMVPTKDENSTNPPELTELKTEVIGTETKNGTDNAGNIEIPQTGPGGIDNMGKITETEKTPVGMGAVEVLPEPYGGAAAWQKFLQRNIHYPPQASEAGVQGKVFLSFIVEMDGHLSNITVEHGAGSGLDEEAVRVLKLAPAWKPGIQNGHKVRVKYTIPINFMIPDPE
jgi:protein TonB